ncbi:two-component system response regulator RR class II (RRII)-LuxR [Synechococcus sp. SYN20]|nr:two-component system response regulator RR class II (RRII)-LuxR [Synechococcus sp. SYN20]
MLISEQLNNGSGLDLLREIKRLNPGHRCIVVLNQKKRERPTVGTPIACGCLH